MRGNHGCCPDPNECHLELLIRSAEVRGWFTMAAFFCCRALLVVLASTTICAAANHRQSSWNRSAELKNVGYVELFGADAIHFLVGNSVLVKKSSPLAEKDGIQIYPKIYYFLNDHTMYECGVAKEPDCTVRLWGLEGNQVCLEIGGCGEPPKVMKSPSHSEGKAKKGDRLGVYLWFDHFAYDIVKGNRIDAPLFDAHISGHPIELNRTDIGEELKEASQYSGEDKQVPISGPRAVSLLIGNTFLSDDVAKYSKDQTTNACPEQGTYYSPDGRVLHFTCHAGPSNQIWSISISHWKIKSGQLCRTFGCDGVTAIPVPQGSSTSDKMFVQDLDTGNALTGYAGNALNFRFENDAKADSEKK